MSVDVVICWGDGFVDKIFGEEVGIDSGTVVGVLSNTGCAVLEAKYSLILININSLYF